MGVEGLLSIRWRERAELLRRIDQGIRRDCRVRAAWMAGSVARSEDDALSDLDLFIVVADDATVDFVDNRRVHAAGPARPILAGPQHVDWFWQAESTARRPDDGKILFDHAGLPVTSGAQWRSTVHQSSGAPLGPSPSLTDLLTHKIAFFWAMSFIVAKDIARRNRETVARMIGVVSRTLTEAAALCDNSVVLSQGYEAMTAALEAASATTQLQVLRELAGHAEALGGQLATHGIALPSEAVIQAYQFFELVEALVVRDVDLLSSP